MDFKSNLSNTGFDGSRFENINIKFSSFSQSDQSGVLLEIQYL